jgi:hypothetical protein
MPDASKNSTRETLLETHPAEILDIKISSMKDNPDNTMNKPPYIMARDIVG